MFQIFLLRAHTGIIPRKQLEEEYDEIQQGNQHHPYASVDEITINT